jgi:hypothetical protein
MVIPQPIDRFSERFYKRHYWYVDLVVRSKVMDIEGREPSYHEFAEHGSRIITPDSTETWLWREVPLISYNSTPRYRYDTATARHLLIFDYIR